MLIEFSVSNYRSIREKQVFSMVATKDTSHEASNCLRSGMASLPCLLNSAVLYGPNAGGKTNLLMALAAMRQIVEVSATGIREGQLLPVMPFRFDPEMHTQPTEFEIIFIDQGVRYQYGFAATPVQVVREWLFVYVGQKGQRWFEREYDAKSKQDFWKFSTHFTGGKKRDIWKESTRSNALFLSTAVNLNNEQLRPIFHWFVDKLVLFSGNSSLNPGYTVNSLKTDFGKSAVIEFLQAADLGIMDVEVTPQTFANITLFHQGKTGVVPIHLSEESQGTQRLFSYAGPILDVLQKGCILIVDELDSSLHPKMVRFLIDLIRNPALNQHQAQMIFSTHDTSLLDTELFRRDQIWFMEKDRDQASRLYPLSDFSPRKDEALEKGYLAGRYGALPIFGEVKF